MNAIYTFLFNILNAINAFIGSYGWSIVVFILLIKLLLLPLDIRSRRSMRRMSDLNPQLEKLKQKYGNDKEKLNQKTAELYTKEHISPLSGCLPMLISMPVLFAMFGALRMLANVELAKQVFEMLAYGTQTNEGWLWVKNLWMPDAPFASAVAQESQLRSIPVDIWVNVLNSLPDSALQTIQSLGITAGNFNADSYLLIQDALLETEVYTSQLELWSALPSINLVFVDLQLYASPNGLVIAPVLAAVTQFISTLSQSQTTGQNASASGNSTGKIMKYFFPLFSLFICLTYNAGFAIYWVVSNVFAIIEGYAIKQYLDRKQDKASAIVAYDALK